MARKRFGIFLVLAALLLTMACNLLEAAGADDIFDLYNRILFTDNANAEIQIMETAGGFDTLNEPEAPTEPVIEFGGVGVDDSATTNDKFATCTQFEIIEEDIKKNPDTLPQVMIWANAENHTPPDGYQINYNAPPATFNFSDTARGISHDGAHVSITTTAPVRCAQVMVVGTSISPLEIYLDDTLIWEGYLRRREDDNGVDYYYYYFRIPVSPARPVTLNVIGYSYPPDNVGNTFAAWVPIEFFGFELP